MTKEQEESIEKIKRQILIGECGKNIGMPVFISDLKNVLAMLKEKDNRIKELESDNYECNNIIREYIEDWELKNKIIELMAEHLTTPIHSKKDVIEYFENLAKESGEKDEDNRIIE